jgi:hypothetical protein
MAVQNPNAEKLNKAGSFADDLGEPIPYQAILACVGHYDHDGRRWWVATVPSDR